MSQPRNIIEPLRPYGKIVLIVLILVLLFVLFLLMRSCLRSRLTGPEVGGGFPGMRNKPQPVNRPFEGCPPEGDGSDPVLNRLKNRVDEGNYVPVQFDAIAQLQWPKTVERKHHDKWSDSDTAAVARYEGTPVSVEGYLADAREEGPESPNCHGADHQFRDFHI